MKDCKIIRFLSHKEFVRATDYLQEGGIATTCSDYWIMELGAIHINEEYIPQLKLKGFLFEEIDDVEKLYSDKALKERYLREMEIAARITESQHLIG